MTEAPRPRGLRQHGPRIVKRCGRNAGVAVIAVLMAAAPACTNAGDSDREASPSATTTVRAACEVALPAAWQQAIEGSAVSTGGISTVPLAVGRAGEVVAVRDNGDTRDLLLIGADKSIREIYAVPDPDLNDVGFVAMDDRWIVVGVDRIPRDANGVIPMLIRIDLIDRHSGSVRTLAQGAAPGDEASAAQLGSVALFRGKVYWVETFTEGTRKQTVLTTYDLGKGRVVTTESGAKAGVWANASGLSFGISTGTPLLDGWARLTPVAEVKIAAPLPTPVADALGTGRDRLTLVTDGTAYAWITGFDHGGTGVAWWSRESGLVRVTGEVTGEVVPLPGTTALPPVHVVGPYVVVGKSGGSDTPEQDTFAAVVDTRSGAVTFLHNRVTGADGGTIAMRLAPNPAKGGASTLGVVRSDALPPLSC